ncbi:MAG: CAP domain-containing protein [Actinomycetota bacterium]
MRGREIPAAAVLVAAVAAAATFLGAGRGHAVAVRETSLEQSYAVAINEARAANGLGPLTVEAALVVASRRQSERLRSTDTFAHGARWWRRLVEAGASGRVVGENLGWCARSLCAGGTPATLVRMWLASPEHRTNMLDPRFDHIGVGIAFGAFKGYPHAYVVTTDFDG